MCEFSIILQFLVLIVTFTTDFGTRDYYAATLKGAMLCEVNSLTFVDITHYIKPYDIVAAAYILRHAYKSFPAETVHIIAVDNHYQQQTEYIIAQHEGHYFIAPDNGILTLIFDGLPSDAAYRLPFPSQLSAFPLKDVYAKAISYFFKNKSITQIGPPAHDLVQRITLQPVVTSNFIRGSVIHIDNYENVVVNITEKTFTQAIQTKPFELYFKRNYPITKLSESYHDVAIGETLCLFNAAGLLEIAVNMGRAATLLSLNLDDTIQLIFE
ncbi:MAG: hypothetical protein RI894_1562 [Bacteroidota bacterium]